MPPRRGATQRRPALPRLAFVALAVGAGLVGALLLLGPRTTPTSSGTAHQPRERDPIPVPSVLFTDVTEAAGVPFRHANGASGRKLLPETMGSGVAVFDFDG